MSGSTVLFGCGAAVVSSIVQSLGITLQRKSHITPDQCHQNLNQYKLWLCGFCLFIAANVLGSLIQISTLPLIILSPLQSVGLISNSILSCVLLHEPFTWKLGTGTFVISVGAFIIAYNGQVDVPETSLAIVVDHLTRPRFLNWFICTFVFCGALVVLNKFVIIKYRNARFIQGINYGIVSGTLTAHTFLFAKSIIDVLLQSILSKSNIFANFTPYLLLAIMLLIIGLQLTAFNLGLAKISTSVLYPLCFLVFNLFNLINDLIFNQLLPEKISYSQLHKVIFGLTSVLCGVVLLSWDGFWAQPDEELQVIIRHNVADYGTIKHPIKRTLSFEKNQITLISS